MRGEDLAECEEGGKCSVLSKYGVVIMLNVQHLLVFEHNIVTAQCPPHAVRIPVVTKRKRSPHHRVVNAVVTPVV